MDMFNQNMMLFGPVLCTILPARRWECCESEGVERLPGCSKKGATAAAVASPSTITTEEERKYRSNVFKWINDTFAVV